MIFRLLAMLFVFALPLSPASAQSYPSKPVRIIVGMAPGTTVDMVARIIAVGLDKQLGQPVIVENRVGAGGSIAANFVSRSAPDGYTLWLGTPTTIHPIYIRNNPVILGKNLEPITDVFSTPYVMYVSNKIPATSFKELVAYAQKQPLKTLNFASITPTFDLLMQLLGQRSNLSYTNVPYLGGIPASITALRAGDVDFALGGLIGFPAQVQSGTLHALFITAPKRSSILPAVPTAAEAGIPDFEVASTSGLVAPPATPPELLAKVAAAVKTVLQDKEIADKIRGLGCDPIGLGAAAQVETYNKDIKLLTEAARIANFQPQ